MKRVREIRSRNALLLDSWPILAVLTLLATILSGCDLAGGEGGQLDQRVLSESRDLTTDANIENAPLDDYRQRLLNLINQARAEGRICGEYGYMPPAPPLTWNTLLETSASNTVDEMAAGNYFSHNNPTTGENAGNRIAAVGYRYIQWGENLEAGYGTPEAAMQALLDSQSHCRILMRPYWREVGWFRRETPEDPTYRTLGAQHFGLPR